MSGEKKWMVHLFFSFPSPVYSKPQLTSAFPPERTRHVGHMQFPGVLIVCMFYVEYEHKYIYIYIQVKWIQIVKCEIWCHSSALEVTATFSAWDGIPNWLPEDENFHLKKALSSYYSPNSKSRKTVSLDTLASVTNPGHEAGEDKPSHKHSHRAALSSRLPETTTGSQRGADCRENYSASWENKKRLRTPSDKKKVSHAGPRLSRASADPDSVKPGDNMATVQWEAPLFFFSPYNIGSMVVLKKRKEKRDGGKGWKK